MKYIILPLWRYLIKPILLTVNFILSSVAAFFTFVGIFLWKFDYSDAASCSRVAFERIDDSDEFFFVTIAKLMICAIGCLLLAGIKILLWNLL